MCKNACCSNVEKDCLSVIDYKDIESRSENDITQCSKAFACSKAIFSHESWKNWSYEDDGCYLLIYPSFTEIKNGSHQIELPPEPIIPPEYDRVKRNRRAYRRWQISQDTREGIPPRLNNNNTKIDPKRGVITGFSRKAGTRMKKRMLSFVHPPEMWVDLTYSDDVMMGLSIEEQKDYDNKCFKKFKRKLEKKFPKIEGVSRREWQDRKSGSRIGEETPHRHNLIRVPGLSDKQKLRIILWILNIWVKCTGTKEKEKALKVALHEKSYRLIESAKQAQIYVSKYVSKYEQHDDRVSRGRFWMKIGYPELAKAVAIPLTKNEDKLLRRFFRRYVGRKTKLHKIIKNGFMTWVEIHENTVLKMLEWIKKTSTSDALTISLTSDVPF